MAEGMLLMLLMPVSVLAEDVQGTRDISAWVICLGVCCMLLVRYLLVRRILPLVQFHRLNEEARIVVSAVEGLLGRGSGEQKWAQALEFMAARGYKVDSEQVQESLKAAWQLLDMAQVLAGIKTIPEE
ncbi:MAG: hypothetical protein IJ708_06020 [Clostridia bacterium]|nr:hypothetical protein [Clostridia bacterium]